MEKGKKELTDISIETLIYEIRGQKVMLDKDLAKLYGVETKVLNQAVKRNINRFPEDFMFQITKDEYDGLKCHFGISNSKGGDRGLPHVFTELGVSMLAGLLRIQILI